MSTETSSPTPAERRPLRLGIYGYGDVGHGLALGLGKEGLAGIVAYQRVPVRESIQAKAAAAGARLVATPLELAAAADVIIAVTQGSKAADAARAIAPGLGPGHLYVDLASATPAIKQEIGTVLAPRGARYAEGAIEGSPLVYEHRFGVIVSGAAAGECAARLNPWGMKIEVVGDTIGHASTIKGLRHILMKGQAALMLEAGIAARRAGIDAALFASVTEWYDARSWLLQVGNLARTTAVHAERRSEEAAMAIEIMHGLGMEPVMTPRTVELLQRVAALGLRERLDRKVPDDLGVALDLMSPAYPPRT